MPCGIGTLSVRRRYRSSIFDPDEILLLRYPQYSTATSASSFTDWKKAAAKAGLVKPTYTLCCYPVDKNWATAQSDLLRAQIDTLEKEQKYRVLFSAHGLPKKSVDRGDPYQWQVERSADAIAKVADLTEETWMVCYQSRSDHWNGLDRLSMMNLNGQR